MLSHLRHNVSGAVLATTANIDKLPFRYGTLDSAICRYVLHLVTEWRSAVSRVIATLKPHGYFLVELNATRTLAPYDPWQPMWQQFRSRLNMPDSPGVSSFEELDIFMLSRGWPSVTLPRIIERRWSTVDLTIRQLAERYVNQGMDRHLVHKAAIETLEWTQEKYRLSPSENIPIERHHIWHAYCASPSHAYHTSSSGELGVATGSGRTTPDILRPPRL
jgi:SAM-dependent methyltransferase